MKYEYILFSLSESCKWQNPTPNYKKLWTKLYVNLSTGIGKHNTTRPITGKKRDKHEIHTSAKMYTKENTRLFKFLKYCTYCLPLNGQFRSTCDETFLFTFYWIVCIFTWFLLLEYFFKGKSLDNGVVTVQHHLESRRFHKFLKFLETERSNAILKLVKKTSAQ